MSNASKDSHLCMVCGKDANYSDHKTWGLCYKHAQAIAAVFASDATEELPPKDTPTKLDEILRSIYSDGFDNQAYLENRPQPKFKPTMPEAKQAITEYIKEIIGEDEKLKDVKNRSILDAPKVKIQNLYRADRNNLRQSQRKRLEM